jgi:hypothetical protein
LKPEPFPAVILATGLGRSLVIGAIQGSYNGQKSHSIPTRIVQASPKSSKRGDYE